MTAMVRQRIPGIQKVIPAVYPDIASNSELKAVISGEELRTEIIRDIEPGSSHEIGGLDIFSDRIA